MSDPTNGLASLHNFAADHEQRGYESGRAVERNDMLYYLHCRLQVLRSRDPERTRDAAREVKAMIEHINRHASPCTTCGGSGCTERGFMDCAPCSGTGKARKT